MIKEKSVQQFLDELASQSSTPGGGSAAAILGAIGVALVSMVANLTVDKKGYEAANPDMRTVLRKSEELRTDLTELIQADIKVFKNVMIAYGMPVDSQEQQTERSSAIQTALKEATDIPLGCARYCAEVMHLSASVAEMGNRNVISDAGVAALAAYAGLRSAALNVYINLNAIKDEAFVEQRQRQLEEILSGTDELNETVYEVVKSKL